MLREIDQKTAWHSGRIIGQVTAAEAVAISEELGSQAPPASQGGEEGPADANESGTLTADEKLIVGSSGTGKTRLLIDEVSKAFEGEDFPASLAGPTAEEQLAALPHAPIMIDLDKNPRWAAELERIASMPMPELRPLTEDDPLRDYLQEALDKAFRDMEARRREPQQPETPPEA